MLTDLNFTRVSRLSLAALLLSGVTLSYAASTHVAAQQGHIQAEPAIFENTPASHVAERTKADAAATSFIHALANADADAVWMFASEEDQAAFGTESAVYEAFAETFPALTQAKDVTLERAWQEGDTPFVELAVSDASGGDYQVTIGLWLDDAGDWKVISCDVKATGDKLAMAE